MMHFILGVVAGVAVCAVIALLFGYWFAKGINW